MHSLRHLHAKQMGKLEKREDAGESLAASITGGSGSEESKTKAEMLTSQVYSKGNDVSKRTFKSLRHHKHKET